MSKTRLFLFSIFCLTAFNSNSQDTTFYINDYKIKLGLKLTAEKCNYDFEEGGYRLFSGGIQLVERIKASCSSFETGLYLLPTATRYSKNYIYTDPLGNIYNQHFDFDIEYYYLTIPINYRFETRLFYFSGGLFFNNLLFRYGEYLTYTDSIEYYKTDRKINWGWILTVGLEKHVSDNINLFVEGKYVNTISSFKTDGNFILNNNSLEASFTNYGISIGFNYKIKKMKKDKSG